MYSTLKNEHDLIGGGRRWREPEKQQCGGGQTGQWASLTITLPTFSSLAAACVSEGSHADAAGVAPRVSPPSLNSIILQVFLESWVKNELRDGPFLKHPAAWKRLASSPQEIFFSSHAELVSGDLDACALYSQFIVIEFCVFLLVKDELDVFEDRLQSYLTHMNETETLTPVILQVQELISVTKGKATHPPIQTALKWPEQGA